MIKAIIATCGAVLACCSEKASPSESDKPTEAFSVDRWHPLQRSVGDYQKLQTNRAILVLFTVDWNATGLLIRRHLNQPKILALCSHYQVLPLIANYSEFKSLAAKEKKKLQVDPNKITSNFFLLRTAQGKSIIFSHEALNGGALLGLIQQRLESALSP